MSGSISGDDVTALGYSNINLGFVSSETSLTGRMRNRSFEVKHLVKSVLYITSLNYLDVVLSAVCICPL